MLEVLLQTPAAGRVVSNRLNGGGLSGQMKEKTRTLTRQKGAAPAGLVDSPYYPAQAADWANPAKTLKGWKTVLVPVGAPNGSYPPDYSFPGDVIAEAIQYSDATGHVGIIVNNLQHQTVSADSAVQCYAPPTPAGTITNTDYGFRPDNYVDPTGCRKYGLKRYAVVKRFFGQ